MQVARASVHIAPAAPLPQRRSQRSPAKVRRSCDAAAAQPHAAVSLFCAASGPAAAPPRPPAFPICACSAALASSASRSFALLPRCARRPQARACCCLGSDGRLQAAHTTIAAAKTLRQLWPRSVYTIFTLVPWLGRKLCAAAAGRSGRPWLNGIPAYQVSELRCESPAPHQCHHSCIEYLTKQHMCTLYKDLAMPSLLPGRAQVPDPA